MFRKSGRIILDEYKPRGTGIIFYSDGCRKWNELLRHPFASRLRDASPDDVAVRVAHFYRERRFEVPYAARFAGNDELFQDGGTGERKRDFHFFRDKGCTIP